MVLCVEMAHGRIGMGAWGCERGDVSVGMRVWGWESGDGSMEMGA